MAVTKVIIVDSPEKMRTQSAGYSIIIPQIKERAPHSEQTNTKKKPKVSNKKNEITVLLPELGPPSGGPTLLKFKQHITIS